MKRVLALWALMEAVVIAIGLLVGMPDRAQAQPGASRPAPSFPAALIERGRYLAIAGDCAACHTLPEGGRAFAGGYAIVSPLGPIYASNITPSRKAGIGGYSEAQFGRALREGVRADGARLYPAMPYTAYAGLTDADVHALYAYFMAGVAPVDVEAQRTRLRFPFNLRVSMRFWNALFFKDQRFRPEPGRSPQWNRGAYLVNVLGHCSTCHSPRGFLMQEKSKQAYAGGVVGPHYAPNITGDPVSGIGGWSGAELVRYFRTGAIHPKAQASGGMAEAIENSLQYLRTEDLAAMALYLKSLPPIRNEEETQPAFTRGRPAGFEAGLRGSAVSGHVANDGAALYSANCASCHGIDGGGSRDQHYPALFHNSSTGGGRADNLVAAILYGVSRKSGGQFAFMPRFGEKSYAEPLSDAEIASVSNYVLQTFGNSGIHVSEKDVAQSRAGGPTSPLMRLTAFLVPLAALLVVALAAILFLIIRRRKGVRPA